MSSTAADSERTLRVVQRVVLPDDANPHAVPNYVDGQIVRVPAAQNGNDPNGKDRHDRFRCIVPPGAFASFGAYFNAFPAGYWRRWTNVREVTLRVTAGGQAMVTVFRSTAKGHSWPVETVQIEPGEPRTLEWTLPLEPFIDGGWYWFDVAAPPSTAAADAGQQDGAIMDGAEWLVRPLDAQHESPGRLSVGITTFNRPDYCVQQLVTLGANPDVLNIIDKIFIVDQGTKKVADEEGFEAAAAAVGGRLRLIDQTNLGGSGGFARSMYEALQADESQYLLLLDDDVVTEPESFSRAVAFADFTRDTTIVGGHMFSLYDRTVLHSYGEVIYRHRWFWGPAPKTFYGHDFRVHPLRYTPWLHRRIDVDYNGWWMCLIPLDVIRQAGLPLPLFIKWDDAEWGLRAKKLGLRTVTLPGVAVWHVPWHEKDDTIDWQAYFHERNRLLSGLLHSRFPHGGSLIRESMQACLRHLSCMQYSAAELVLRAVEDLLSGPEHLHRDLPSILGEVRELRKQFPDAQNVPTMDEFPQVRDKRLPAKRSGWQEPPRGRVGLYSRAAKALLRNLLPVDPEAKSHPQTVVPHVDQAWWLLAGYDSALVSSADGTATAWYVRDRERFVATVARAVRLHAELYRRWPELRTAYQDALPDLVSPEQWKGTFTGSPEPLHHTT